MTKLTRSLTQLLGRSSKSNKNPHNTSVSPNPPSDPPPNYVASALGSPAPIPSTNAQNARTDSPQYAAGDQPGQRGGTVLPFSSQISVPGDPLRDVPIDGLPPMATAPQMGPPRRESFHNSIELDADRYQGLSRFDTVFLIDDSGSMSGANWRQTSAALSVIVPICTAHDSDGVDIYFLNNPGAHTHIRSSTEVLSIFSAVRPSGATPTGRKLGELFALYLKSYKRNRNIKPLNIIVITDGEPTDPDKLERNIVNTAKELDDLKAEERQIGVQFFQVGSDEAATESLEELDNSLSEEWNVRDMVDTVSWKKMNEGRGLSADGILKVVLGAVDKSLDRKRKL